MPSFCVVDNCCDKYGHAESISFHKFPFKRKDLLQIWTDFTQRGPTWKPTKWSAICSQHFIAEDFNCANARKTLKKTAVPTVRLLTRQTVRTEQTGKVESKKGTPVKASRVENEKVTPTEQSEGDYDEREEISVAIEKIIAPIGPKINCRLCGVSASAACTFSTNFEIFGMIQKCFPTLNIQQDDNLPKDMCNICLKRLQSFSEFIDKVLEAQRELQQKFRPEKHIKQSLEPRSLKIKQEPIVKVKQEVAEGLESFISEDLDAAMDECCEPENDTASVDQKFGFCDFPMLNAQDIINNCDIMEIINLDDPFINIPDDDAATINASVQLEKSYMLSAHQLLQTHMLIDEHNYACPAEDLKEEWQIKKCCKTEEADAETELYEQLEAAEAGAEDDYQNCGQVVNANACVNVIAEPMKNDEVERSARPIVTSVSAIAESRLQVHNQQEVAPTSNSNSSSSNNSNKIVVTSISDLLPGTSPPKPSSPQKEGVASCKPNIVVLNESIVKSTEGFQLHACAVCQLKFFGIESLQQHVNFTHMRSNVAATNAVPMVSLPIENLAQGNETQNLPNKDNNSRATNTLENSEKSHKLGEYDELLNYEQKHPEAEESENVLSQQLRNLQSWQLNMKTLQLNALINTWTHGQTSNTYQNSSALQQDCNKAQALNETQINEIYATAPQQREVTLFNAKTTHEIEEVKPQLRSSEEPQFFKAPQCVQKGNSSRVRRSFGSSNKTKTKYKAASSAAASSNRHKVKTIAKTSPHHIAVNFKFLQRRYSQLLRKCKELQENCQILVGGNKPAAAHHLCSQCDSSFFSIYQLLQHKQKYHRPAKLYSVFSASCHGCEKYFLSKIALRNHMKYICQSLSLRWFKTQLQTFKCRQCRSISFTHWRLFRNHEISCKRKMQLQQCRKLHKCTQCPKKFAHVHTLALHMEALHQAAWNLKCLHCNRKFQCLTSLMEHHAKAACKINPPSDCAVLCCTCRQYFQHYNKLLAHQRCCKSFKPMSKAAATNNQHQVCETKVVQYACNMCPKIFASTNSLSQHRITHTQERRHKCGLCLRAFKRRGGLTQHMKGFHLQLKPHECSVCKYRYSLKCDMQRCKHSMMQKRIVPAAASAVEE